MKMKWTVPTLILILGIISSGFSAPPSNWVEHWFEHNQNLSLVFSDADVAIYFDKDVKPTITWPNKYIGDLWRYTKRVYGDFGTENNLYAIFHAGKYSGGHPATYFDAHHDNRNVIDCGSSSLDAWTTGQGNDLDITTHEVAHVVEGAAKGVKNSPQFGIWGDSKWAEIFNYDVYLGLGMTDDATRWYNMMIAGRDNFPRANTAWFKDWFFPIYSQHGETAVVKLSRNFNTYEVQSRLSNAESYLSQFMNKLQNLPDDQLFSKCVGVL